MWEISANVEQHNHWSLEKSPLERFTALDICKFTAKWLVSCSLLLAEKRRDASKRNGRLRASVELSARFFVWTGDGFARDATQR